MRSHVVAAQHCWGAERWDSRLEADTGRCGTNLPVFFHFEVAKVTSWPWADEARMGPPEGDVNESFDISVTRQGAERCPLRCPHVFISNGVVAAHDVDV